MASDLFTKYYLLFLDILLVKFSIFSSFSRESFVRCARKKYFEFLICSYNLIVILRQTPLAGLAAAGLPAAPAPATAAASAPGSALLVAALGAGALGALGGALGAARVL